MQKLKEKNGVSMVLALITSLVILLASASLFAAVSTMVKSTANERAWQRARILASSVGEEIKEDFRHVEIKELPSEEGEEASREYQYQEDYPHAYSGSIPEFVYQNLGTGKWQWYNEDEPFRSKAAATQSFDFGTIRRGEENAGDVKVEIYWKSEGGNELKEIYDERELFITVIAVVGQQECSMTYKYSYSGKKGEGYLWKTPVLVS